MRSGKERLAAEKEERLRAEREAADAGAAERSRQQEADR